MKKLLLLSVAFLGMVGCKKDADKSNKPVVKIGITTPMSGDVSIMGQNTKIGAEMALEDNKNTKLHYELLIEDDRFKAKKAVMITNKFLFQDKINAVISTASTTGNAVQSIAENNNLVHINICSSSQEVLKGKHNFLHWTHPEEEARVLVKYWKDKGYKKVINITQNQSGAMALSDYAEKEASKAGIKIETIFVNDGIKNYSMQIEEIRKKNPDTVNVVLLPPNLGIFSKQFKSIEKNISICSMELIGFSSTPELFEGDVYCDASVGDNDFIERFYQKTGNRNNYISPFSYDAVDVLIETYETLYVKLGRVATADEVSDYILSIKDRNSKAGNLSVDERGFFSSDAVMKTIRNGKVEVLRD